MKSISRTRRSAWTHALALLLGAAACDGGSASDDAPIKHDTACEGAIARFERLREESLESDPVLAKFPDLAREHARQTRDVFVTPLALRCDDAAFVQCLKSAESFNQATACQ